LEYINLSVVLSNHNDIDFYRDCFIMKTRASQNFVGVFFIINAFTKVGLFFN